MTAPPLLAAVELVTDAEMRAHLRGDPDAAARLDLLTRAFERESEYDRNIELCDLPIVRRRLDAPAACTIGWYFKNDPHVRAMRRALGLRVDYETDGAAT